MSRTSAAMGTKCLFLLLMIIGVTVAKPHHDYQGSGALRNPAGCQPGSCGFEVEWKNDGTHVWFDVWTRMGKGNWFGIGFSDDRFMPKTDCVIGGIPADGYNFMLMDSYLTAKSPSGVMRDIKQDAVLKSHSHSNGIMKYQFTRKINTGDSADMSLNKCRYLLFAWGGNMWSTGRISKHTNVFSTMRRICIIPLPTIGPPITIAPIKGHGYEPEAAKSTPTAGPTITIIPAPAQSYQYETSTSFSYPGQCDMGYCDFHATWHADSTYVYFEIWAKVGDGIWAGVGFSDDRKMPKSDCITGWRHGNTLMLYDRYLKDRSPDAVPVDKQQDAIIQSHSHHDGILHFTFKRKIMTGDPYDKSLNECRYFFFAWGGKGHSDGSITPHTAQFVSRKKICLGIHTTIGPPITYKPLPTITIMPPPAMNYAYETANSFSYPGQCDLGYCDFHAKWHVDSTYIYFKIWAKVGDGIWAGVGFSDGRKMPKSDCITGWRKGNTLMLYDRYLKDRSPDAVPVDKQQDAIIQSHSHHNGILHYTFKRRIITGDPYDKSLDECRYFFFAWGGKGHMDGSITPHTAQFVSRQKICLGVRPTIGPPITYKPLPEITIMPPPAEDYVYETANSFSYPGRCPSADCDFHAKWHADSIYVYFTILAKVGQGIWAGVGFSDDRKMPKSDCITGWTHGKDFMLYDRYLKDRSPDAVPVDKQQDAIIQSHSHHNGMLHFTFKRKIVTNDPYDKSLDECRYFFFAWGGKGHSDGSITPHTAQFASKKKICIAHRPTIKPITFSTTLSTTAKPKDYGYETQRSFKYPSYCETTSGNCDFEANWKADSGYVHFTIEAKLNKGLWAGIGFSDDRMMPNSDCITGWMSKSAHSFMLKDRYLFAKKANAVILDSQQDAEVLSYQHDNGMLKFSFRRKMVTGDDRDKSLDKCRYFLFSWGGKAYDNGYITAHTAQFATKKKICFKEYNPCHDKKCGYNQHCTHHGGKANCQCRAGYYMSAGGHCLTYNYNPYNTGYNYNNNYNVGYNHHNPYNTGYNHNYQFYYPTGYQYPYNPYNHWK